MTERHPLLKGVWPPAQSTDDGMLDFTRPHDDLQSDSNIQPPDPNFLDQDPLLLSTGDEPITFPGLAGSSLEIISSAEVILIQQSTEESPTTSSNRKKQYPETLWFRILLIVFAVFLTAVSLVARDIARDNRRQKNDKSSDEYTSLLFSVIWAPILFLIPAGIYRIFINSALPILDLPRKSLLLSITLGCITGVTQILVTFSTAQTSVNDNGTRRTAPRAPVFIVTILGMAGIPLILLARLLFFGDRSSWMKLILSASVFVAHFIAIEPIVFNLDLHEPYPFDNARSLAENLVWPLLYFLAIGLLVFGYVLLEKISRKNDVGSFAVLAWASSFQVIVIFSLFWLDMLPSFGISQSFSGFTKNIQGTFRCQFGFEANCHQEIYITWIYILTDCGARYLQFLTIRHIYEANYVFLLLAIALPAATLIKGIIMTVSPGLHITNITSIAFASGSFLIMVPCILLYGIFY